jgi:hypothetical protein
MGLFIDGNISNLQDLRGHETSILDTASNEGIDLGSKLALAQQELALELEAFLRRNPESAGGVSVEHVVVTEMLRCWHTLETLAVTFRDLSHSQVNDRYQAKAQIYKDLADRAGKRCLDSGVGLVDDPVSIASRAELSYEAGPGAGGSFHVQVAWTNAAGAEGEPGEVSNIEIPADHVLRVETRTAAGEITGWNVYAGNSPDDMTMQNEVPLSLESVWMMPAEGLRTGPRAGKRQAAEYFATESRRLRRG